MKPTAFDYHAPETAAGVVGLLAEHGDGAKVIAGGQSLAPMLALRLAVFDHLVDVRRVPELRGITRAGGTGSGSTVRIGAGTTQAAIGRSPEVAAAVPLLSRATPLIGHFQIRNRGTLGGSVAHADASAEYPAVALTLDATVETLSPRGTRSIPAAEFFTGIWTTALEPDELLTSVTFPSRGERSGFAIEEFAARRGDFAVAGAAVAVELAADGTVRHAGIGLFGLGPTALRAPGAEAQVNGAPADGIDADEVGRTAMAGLDAVPSDSNGDAAYRTRVGAALVARAWRRAVKEASGE